MIYDVSKLNATKIVIGRRGENLATSIEIDVSSWLTEFPSATLHVVVMRPGDTAPYVASTSVSNGVLTWPITNVDTENAGKGKIEVRASAGSVMKKSVLATIEIEPCILCDENAEPPELDPALVEQAIAAAGRAESAAQEAKDILTNGVSWDGVLDKPSVYPPASHGHSQSDIAGLSNVLSQRDRVVNLLDNSWFGNPIAQAGQNAMHGSTKYVCDRWITYGDDTVFGAGYITTGSSIDQKISASIDPSEAYTVAVGLADGTILAYSGNIDTGIGLYASIFAGYSSSAKTYFVRIGANQNVRWVALYEGAYTADTLPAYQYKGYAAELAECMRYYENSWFNTTKATDNEYMAVCVHASGFDAKVEYKVPKRIAATITFYPVSSAETWRVYNDAGYRPLLSVAAQNKNGIHGFIIRGTKDTANDTSVWTHGKAMPVMGHWEASADL